MKVAGCYQVMRHSDRAMPTIVPRSLLGHGCGLDVRVWCLRIHSMGPMLLVNASKRFGRAVQRNRFRRQVRMAFLNVLREQPTVSNADYIIWIRPAKSAVGTGLFSFQEIENQIRLALSRWEVR